MGKYTFPRHKAVDKDVHRYYKEYFDIQKDFSKLLTKEEKAVVVCHITPMIRIALKNKRLNSKVKEHTMTAAMRKLLLPILEWTLTEVNGMFDNILQRSPKSSTDITVYRGLSLSGINLLKSNTDSYISTTFVFDEAVKFTRQNNCCIIELLIKKNFQTLYLDTIVGQNYINFDQVIFPKNYHILVEIENPNMINGKKVYKGVLVRNI
jgi:hypothetical protein